MTTYFVAPRIVAGPGAIEQLSALAAKRAVIVVDPALAAADRHRRLVEELAKTETVTEIVPGPPSEPTIDSVEALAGRVRSARPEWIVALGGGRTIDAAKAAWVRYAHPDVPLGSVTPLVDLQLRSAARFVAVPTTTGSGCDAAWTALVRTAGGDPVEVASRELVPDWSLLDPSLPESLPLSVLVGSVAEFVTHALEACASEWSNPFSDALARDALATAFRSLPAAARRSTDLDARGALQAAATAAGLAWSNAQLGATHALAVALGPESDLAYGRLLGILAPYVSEFNYPSSREKFGTLSGIFGPGAGKDRSGISERLRGLWGPFGLPKTLAEAGVPREVLGARRAIVVRRARTCTATVANPRVPTEEEYGRLLDCAFDGTPVTF